MRKNKGDLVAAFGLALYAGVAAATLGIGAAQIVGISDKDGAEKTLIKKGYSDIEIKGHKWLGCGNGDMFRTEYSATNSSGQREDGIVCRGLFKGSVVRTFD